MDAVSESIQLSLHILKTEHTQAIQHSQDISDDANGPHVTRFGVLSIEYLRCHIVGGADLGLHHTPIGIVVP